MGNGKVAKAEHCKNAVLYEAWHETADCSDWQNWEITDQLDKCQEVNKKREKNILNGGAAYIKCGHNA